MEPSTRMHKYGVFNFILVLVNICSLEHEWYKFKTADVLEFNKVSLEGSGFW